ncbi:hypothetical protein NQ318_008658 [Aromia moschata]|uniref:CRAL-TRIO domain-containing protein n=1 Tax=Aromia moschata TaxID=1265417 RepID=A0AAV8XK20_9CUCU|nr:hypothetical protein NQ318_008658 [Aromia moschata]
MTGKYVFTLSEKDGEYAAQYLNETEKSREDGLRQIRKWLNEEKAHLNARLEDKYILPFLRGCKFNLEKTKVKMTNYYTMKKNRPEWFQDRNPELPEIQDLVKLGVFFPLKMRHENKLVVIAKAAAHDPKKYTLDDVCKAGKMILDVAALDDERVQIYGVAAVFDLKGLSFSHMLQVTPSIMKHIVHAWQNDHCKVKQLEFINTPFHVMVLLNLLKSFISDKLKGRVRVHYRGSDTLYDAVDRAILPPEYGGYGKDIETLVGYWNEKLLSRQKWFEEDEQYKAE